MTHILEVRLLKLAETVGDTRENGYKILVLKPRGWGRQTSKEEIKK
jgi:hypothetical protein